MRAVFLSSFSEISWLFVNKAVRYRGHSIKISQSHENEQWLQLQLYYAPLNNRSLTKFPKFISDVYCLLNLLKTVTYIIMKGMAF